MHKEEEQALAIEVTIFIIAILLMILGAWVSMNRMEYFSN